MSRIVRTPEIVGGQARIDSTRIRVADVIRLKKVGWKDIDIAKALLITLEDIKAAEEYYKDHKDEVDRLIEFEDILWEKGFIRKFLKMCECSDLNEVEDKIKKGELLEHPTWEEYIKALSCKDSLERKGFSYKKVEKIIKCSNCNLFKKIGEVCEDVTKLIPDVIDTDERCPECGSKMRVWII